ncbi:MAG: hypothetical protein ACI9BD_000286 [Candidatus Marinamargulisbacteria bacterium]
MDTNQKRHLKLNSLNTSKIRFLKRNFFIVSALVLLFYLGGDVVAQSAELLGTFTENKRRFYFPDSTISQMDHIASTRLDDAIRPSSWPARIPFSACIDESSQSVYYLRFRSFLDAKLVQLPNPGFKSIRDLDLSSDGTFYIVDSGQNSLFIFKLDDSLTPKLYKKLDIPPHIFRIYVSRTKQIFLLTTTNKVIVFNKFFHRVHSIENAMSKDLSTHTVKDITIIRHQTPVVLTQSHIIKYTPAGQAQTAFPIDQSFSRIAHSVHHDLFCLNPESRTISKFNSALVFLDTIDLTNEFKSPPNDITIHESFGFLFVNSQHFASYYGLKSDIKHIKVKNIRDNKGKSLTRIGFTVTFPSKIWITILDTQNQIIRTLMKGEKLYSDRYNVVWDGKDQIGKKRYGQHKVQIRGEGLYSLTNIVKKDALFTP